MSMLPHLQNRDPKNGGRSRLQAFLRDTQGVYIALFAIIGLTVAGGIGGISYDASARANALQVRMQKCLDAAASANGRLLADNDPRLEDRVDKYFRDNCNPSVYMSNIHTNEEDRYVTIYRRGGSMILAADGHAITTIGKLAGFGDLSVRAQTIAVFTQFDLDLAIAIDNSGSMRSSGCPEDDSCGSRLRNAKKGIELLLHRIYAAEELVAGVNVSIIPFSNSVNLDPYNQPWVENWLKPNALAEAKWEYDAKEFFHDDPEIEIPAVQNPNDPDYKMFELDNFVANNLAKSAGHKNDLLGLIDDPEESCKFRGDRSEWWIADLDGNYNGFSGVNPVTYYDHPEGGYCILGKRQTFYTDQAGCTEPRYDGHAIGIWRDNQCYIGNLWKGCIIERSASNELNVMLDAAEIESLLSQRGAYPLGIVPDSLPDGLADDHEDLFDYTRFYEESPYHADFISDAPPNPSNPATLFRPYAWDSWNGVGLRNYTPYKRVVHNTNSSWYNHPDYPAGLGIANKGTWESIADDINDNSTEEPATLFDYLADKNNYNDYLGGFRIRASTAPGAPHLGQPLDERVRFLHEPPSGQRVPFLEATGRNRTTRSGHVIETGRGPNLGCTQPARFLMDNREEIVQVVDDMYAIGNEQSLHSVGFAWVRRALSPRWQGVLNPNVPDRPAEVGRPLHKKVAIMIFDGMSKAVGSRWGAWKQKRTFPTQGTYDSTYLSVAHLFLSLELCEKIKQDDPETELFLILLKPSEREMDEELFHPEDGDFRWLEKKNPPTGSEYGRMENIVEMYRRCASPATETAQYFYYLDRFSQEKLEETFTKIADRMLEVRISQ